MALAESLGLPMASWWLKITVLETHFWSPGVKKLKLKMLIECEFCVFEFCVFSTKTGTTKTWDLLWTPPNNVILHFF